MSIFEKIKQLGSKKILALTLLAIADVFVIAAPYYLKNIIPNIQQYLHIYETDMSKLIAIIGWVTLLTQLPGGWLADKFSSRKMLSIAVAITGLVTIWFGILVLNGGDRNVLFPQYAIIYTLWGISSTPIFWTPLWKLVSQQTEKEEQATAYGLQGSINGFFGIIFISGVGTAVTLITKQNPSNFAYFASYVFMIAAILIATSFGVWFFVKEKPATEKFAIDIKSLAKVMSDWKVWALSIFVMGMYMFQSVFAYYINQMITNVIGVSTFVLLIVGGIRLYGLRMVISGYAGRFADRFKSITLLLLFTLFIGFIIVAIILILPGFGGKNSAFNYANYSAAGKIAITIVLIILFLISSALSWVMVTLRYAQAAEIERPKNSYGAVTAVISLMAFSPDAWFYQIAGTIGEQYPASTAGSISQTGYQIILLVAISVSFIGLLSGLAVYLSNNKYNKKNGISFFRWRDLNNA